MNFEIFPTFHDTYIVIKDGVMTGNEPEFISKEAAENYISRKNEN